ncbi:MAG: heavy metal translocating P-type ATPase [Candidatus Promineifilaceae bacterium]
MDKLELYVANLDCEHDAAAIERLMHDTIGLSNIRIYPKSAKVVLFFDADRISDQSLKAKLSAGGFPAQEGMAIPEQPKPWKNPKVVTSLLSGLLLLVGWLLSLLDFGDAILLVIFAISIVTGGYYFGREAVESLIFDRRIGVEMLMSIAAITAFFLGQPAEGAMLVFLYSISEAAEGYTEERTRSSVKLLMNLAPKSAVILKDGEELEIAADKLAAGVLFFVSPGQAIPTDGIILKGQTSVNQAPITGESLPVVKEPGDQVLAGSLNGEGAIEVRASKSFADNSLSRIIHLVEEAQERKSQSQRWIDRFGAVYSPWVLIISVLLAVIPPLFFNGVWDVWIGRAAVFLVAAAPCALVISIPVAMVATLGTAARRGVLFKGSKFVEELARVRAVAFDKTGTITTGLPEVSSVLVRDKGPVDENELIALAAGIEKRSEHPFAKAIIEYANDRGLAFENVEESRALTGAGAQAIWRGDEVIIGEPSLFGLSEGLDALENQSGLDQLTDQGQSVVLVGNRNEVWGWITLKDTLRASSVQAILDLKDRGIDHIIMLTGDSQSSAKAIAALLEIDEYHARLKPEDKVTKIQELAVDFKHIAMVGDGVNDGPALAEASVGVAMGAAGTDVALETADVALMADDLRKLVYAVDVSRRNQRIVRQNFVLSILMISTLSVFAVFGLLTLPAAIIGHEISEIFVIANGMRMLRG